MLELIDVVKNYQTGDLTTTALTSANLRIAEGEMVAIVGPSGSGKSTMLNILGCLDTPSSGRYLINGKDVSCFDARSLARIRNETFGFVFQFFGLISEYTALENVMLPLLYRRVPFRQAKSEAIAMLQQLGLDSLLNKRPLELSGGQQQRVAVGRALVGNPPVIFADEPTGSLDSESGQQVLTLLHERHARGQTVIVVTHSAEVTARCDRAIHIRDGRIQSSDDLAGPGLVG